MANYDVIEGIRKDSSIFVHGSYSYRKDKDYKGIRYLRCTKFRDGCSARARICLHSNVFSIIQDHGNHETADTQVKITKVISKLKRKAEDSQQSLREIFDEEANQSEVGGNISFVHVESAMYKRRRLHRPQIPLNAESAISLMQTCDDSLKIYHIFLLMGH